MSLPDLSQDNPQKDILAFDFVHEFENWSNGKGSSATEKLNGFLHDTVGNEIFAAMSLLESNCMDKISEEEFDIILAAFGKILSILENIPTEVINPHSYMADALKPITRKVTTIIPWIKALKNNNQNAVLVYQLGLKLEDEFALINFREALEG
ncbi:MAG: hypothetical protein ABIM99_06635 [Candidatus Dojkabacteria bacterium]